MFNASMAAGLLSAVGEKGTSLVKSRWKRQLIAMTAFDLFTIGHSNNAIERFIALLKDAGVNAIADVRSVPYSRFCPWFSRNNLQTHLRAAGIGYFSYGETLGGRPSSADLYRDGGADYEAMAQTPAFRSALDRLQNDMAQHCICLMCAERDPLDCHRCLLVAQALAERGVAIGHILHDGAIEPHVVTEQRLLRWAENPAEPDLFVTGQRDRLAAAYRRRGGAAGYKAKPGTAGAKTAAEQ
jgi:hypothetical protein